MKKLILFNGILMIILVTVCFFNKDNIQYQITKYNISHKYGTLIENEYYIEDHYSYVDNYTDCKISSKKELFDTIYYILNTGTTYAERYCDQNYTNCLTDLNNLANDPSSLSLLNNYLHPFNSFKTITFEIYQSRIAIQIEHVYSEEEKNAINNKVNNFINYKITNSMGTKERIKAVHDYIINNTDYDSLKSSNANDSTYKSNTAYGVLFQKKGICSGYSDTMAIFLNKLNIINYKISNEEHIWNLVYVDGKWYHLDLTWDDPLSPNNITRDTYFLITTAKLKYLADNVHNFNKQVFSEANQN